MGTRGLTAVMFDGEYRIAQYGQWDHYPSGQGVGVLDFCKKWLTDPIKESQFVSNMLTFQFATDIDEAAAKAFMESIGCKDGWMNMEQAEKWKQAYPYWSRDHGGNILGMVAEPLPDTDTVLRNSLSFAGDSVFCEYAYVVDLDKRTLEVFKGFNKTPLAADERFANVERNKRPDGSVSEYHPVRLLAKFDLDKLPSKSVFLEMTTENDE